MSTTPSEPPAPQVHPCNHHQTYKNTHICWKNSGRCPFSPESAKICKHFTTEKQKK